MKTDSPRITVGSFPYSPGFNPYQKLFTDSLEEAGAEVIRISPTKWFPVQSAFAQRCDVIHFDWPHDWYSGRNFATRFLKSWMYRSGLRRESKSRLVWTAHNLIAHDAKHREHEHRMIQRLIDRCDGIVVLSDSAELELRRCYDVNESTSVKTVYHGHYIGSYPNTCSREEARLRLGFADDEQVYLSLGSIRRYKGHENLIRAFSHVSSVNERLVIAGSASDTHYCSDLQRLIKSQSEHCFGEIDFRPGEVHESMLQCFFNGADVSVLAFDSVLNSGSLLLAMSFGLPVIAADQGSLREVAHPEHSILIAPSDEPVAAICEAIVASRLAFATEPQAIRESIIEFTRKKFGWDIVGQQLVEWYEQLLTHPTRHSSNSSAT